MRPNHSLMLLFLLTIPFFISSCEDDSVSSQEEHFEAIGTVIYDASGALSVSILRGETTDTLYAEEGVLSDHFDVKFYNEDEEIVDPPSNSEAKLEYEILDESIAEFWQHEGEEGGFEFHIRGLKKGITKLQLFIAHGDHNDYRSGEFPLVVR